MNRHGPPYPSECVAHLNNKGVELKDEYLLAQPDIVLKKMNTTEKLS
jgi:hypothetical protein